MSEQAVGSERDKRFIAGILLKVSFAAIHTSAAAPSQLLFDLCERPEYVPLLRTEIAEHLGSDGEIPKQAFNKLVKLDSIMKESQRFNPLLLSEFFPSPLFPSFRLPNLFALPFFSVSPNLFFDADRGPCPKTVTFERVVHTDYPLSDGTVIPAHTTVGIPTQAISMDPDLYPDPTTFDGFRFEKLRTERPDLAGKAAYASSNPTSMAFGYGRHACPGRFFAANEIKAIMVYLLEHYEFKFREGEGRPESMLFETQFLPNHAAKLMFRERKAGVGQ